MQGEQSKRKNVLIGFLNIPLFIFFIWSLRLSVLFMEQGFARAELLYEFPFFLAGVIYSIWLVFYGMVSKAVEMSLFYYSLALIGFILFSYGLDIFTWFLNLFS